MSVRDQLTGAGWVEVTLPSGIRVRGIIPTTRELIRRNLIPETLDAKVLASADAKAKARKLLSREEHAVRIAAQRIEAAAFVRQGWDAEKAAWEPLLLTPEDLNEGGMDPLDVDALEDLVLGIRTAAQITAASQAAAGEISADEAEQVQREEAGGTVDGWSEFRNQRPGDADRPGSPGVADDAKPAHARKPRRSRDRSGAGAQPPAG